MKRSPGLRQFVCLALICASLHSGSRQLHGAEPGGLTEPEWQRYVVEIEGSRSNSVFRRFPALVIESSGGLSRVLTASWGAEPFPDSIGHVHSYKLTGLDVPVRLVGFDEMAATAVFEVEAVLPVVPRELLGVEIAVGDRLKELKMAGGAETREHTVLAIDQEYRPRTARKAEPVVPGAIVLDSPRKSTVNTPGALFLKGGRLAAIRQNNAYDDQKVMRPYLVPIDPMLKAYDRLSQPPLTESVKPPVDPGSNGFRRPELVAIAWARTNEQHQGPQPKAWRPDRSLIDEAEAAWIDEEIAGLELDAWPQPNHLPPLLLVFRIDDRARSAQAIHCEVRVKDLTLQARSTAHKSTRNMLAKTAVVPLQDSLAAWPEDVDVLARVPTREPVVLKTIDGPPADAVQVAPGVRWYVDPVRGMRKFERMRVTDLPAAVLEIDKRIADPMAPVSMRVTTKDGKPLSVDRTTTADPDGMIEIQVSRPLTPENPIATATFVQHFYRTEVYDHVPVRLELMPLERNAGN
ncbi:MAG TPA: hypothetical protein VM452_01000 [Caulifigura sp.]|nr:hypothetical protein [Caulifigura sp.]